MPLRDLAAVSASQSIARRSGPRPGVRPKPGGYLGATDESRARRVSFRVFDDGAVRELKVADTLIAATAEVRNGLLRVERSGLELAAVWFDERSVRGEVSLKARWNRTHSFVFFADLRYERG